MKNVTVKVITISSQILVVSLFLLSLFLGKGDNNKVTVVYNDNFDKMADMTLFLFEEEELMTSDVDESQVVVLDDNTDFELSLEEDDFLESEFQETEEDVVQNVEVESENNRMEIESVIETYTGILTGYGPDCVGCGNPNTGKVVTSSGYHISNFVDGSIAPAFTITYNDSEYGEVRIVAADDTMPFYSIVRITVPHWEEPVIAIVLDRGSTVGFENCRSSKGCLTQFDLLYPTEAESLGKTKNVKFELLRSGK